MRLDEIIARGDALFDVHVAGFRDALTPDGRKVRFVLLEHGIVYLADQIGQFTLDGRRCGADGGFPVAAVGVMPR